MLYPAARSLKLTQLLSVDHLYSIGLQDMQRVWATFLALLLVRIEASVIILPSDARMSSMTMVAAKHFRRTLLDIGVDSELGSLVTAASHSDVVSAFSAPFANEERVIIMPLSNVELLWPALAKRCLPASADGFGLCINDGIITVVGGTESSTFHGAITALEMMYGVRYGIEGVMLPSPALALAARLSLPANFAHAASPAFSIRGLQPFHDFDSGPDWWSEDEMKRVMENIAQVLSVRARCMSMMIRIHRILFSDAWQLHWIPHIPIQQPASDRDK